MRQRTEDRGSPPALPTGTRVQLASTLHARVTQVPHPRLVELTFAERGSRLWSRLFAAGSPIQYAYLQEPLALWNVQTAYATVPCAAEMPSAGYGLTWSVLGALRRKGVTLARVTHAAGISSTGDAELDAQLPLRERTHVSAATRRASAGHGVHVEVDVPQQAVVEGDEVRLAQALDNLLDNAVRHGSPPLAVVARADDDEVVLRVSDGGRGVPDDLVPRLFSRHATSGAAGGSGLGLYLVREIVRGHGGDVVYEPPAAEGHTTFVVRLPVRLPNH